MLSPVVPEHARAASAACDAGAPPQPSAVSSRLQPLSSLPPKPSARRAAGVAHTSQTRALNRRSASWSKEEDAKLTQLVSRYVSRPPSITASNTWSRVAQHLPRRTGKQCRERYLNQLRPGIRREPWTFEEETILNQVHARLGNKWVAIAKHLPGRTDNCVKNHWNSMLRKRQRRQAALKQTEKQVCEALSRSNRTSLAPHSTSIIVDNNNADAVAHSATLSELSSHLNDLVSSGIPSPFTVSSPLTPHRDAKLQISSLVASRSTNEMLAWNSLDPIRTPSSQSDVHMFRHKSDLLSPASTSPVPPYAALQISTPINTGTHAAEAEQAGVTCVTPPPKTTNSAKSIYAPVQCILFPNDSQADFCNAPQNIESGPSSICPTPCLKQNSSQSASHIALGVQRKSIAKSVSSSQVPANPLAALAAAASSIPLSPLGPVRRNSATSSSKAVSSWET